jgi:hypothetical protein
VIPEPILPFWPKPLDPWTCGRIPRGCKAQIIDNPRLQCNEDIGNRKKLQRGFRGEKSGELQAWRYGYAMKMGIGDTVERSGFVASEPPRKTEGIEDNGDIFLPGESTLRAGRRRHSRAARHASVPSVVHFYFFHRSAGICSAMN